MLASIKDDTPEGKSTVELAKKLGASIREEDYNDATFVEFSASTKMSGLDTKEHIIRKGAGDAISQYIKEKGGVSLLI